MSSVLCPTIDYDTKSEPFLTYCETQRSTQLFIMFQLMIVFKDHRNMSNRYVLVNAYYIKQLVKQPGSRALESRWVFKGSMCEKYRNIASDVKIYEEVDFLCLVPRVWMCAVDVANNSPDWVCVSPVCYSSFERHFKGLTCHLSIPTAPIHNFPPGLRLFIYHAVFDSFNGLLSFFLIVSSSSSYDRTCTPFSPSEAGHHHWASF